MPKRKYDTYGMIVRNYMVKCPACNNLIFVDYEQDTCQHCNAWICPSCLALLNMNNTWTEELSNANGHMLTITCKKCGYDVVDTDV
jgi:C4-type Zn-finger protein